MRDDMVESSQRRESAGGFGNSRRLICRGLIPPSPGAGVGTDSRPGETGQAAAPCRNGPLQGSLSPTSRGRAPGYVTMCPDMPACARLRLFFYSCRSGPPAVADRRYKCRVDSLCFAWVRLGSPGAGLSFLYDACAWPPTSGGKVKKGGKNPRVFRKFAQISTFYRSGRPVFPRFPQISGCPTGLAMLAHGRCKLIPACGTATGSYGLRGRLFSRCPRVLGRFCLVLAHGQLVRASKPGGAIRPSHNCFGGPVLRAPVAGCKLTFAATGGKGSRVRQAHCGYARPPGVRRFGDKLKVLVHGRPAQASESGHFGGTVLPHGQ